MMLVMCEDGDVVEFVLGSMWHLLFVSVCDG